MDELYEFAGICQFWVLEIPFIEPAQDSGRVLSPSVNLHTGDAMDELYEFAGICQFRVLEIPFIEPAVVGANPRSEQ